MDEIVARFQMPMGSYLHEIRHAVEQLIPLIWEERERLRLLQREVGELSRRTTEGYRQADSWAMNAEDAEDVAMATGLQWETYFGQDKERLHKRAEADPMVQRVAAHHFSAAALASALLQYGKQGISIAHEDLALAPSGRMFGPQALKNVIWQARNQSLHWEDQEFSRSVEGCFDALASEIDRKFGEYRQRNMSIDVVELLEWRDFDAFATDLSSLG